LAAVGLIALHQNLFETRSGDIRRAWVLLGLPEGEAAYRDPGFAFP
jgi:hypothetical protein